MKIIVKDYKKNFVKAKIENLDDLWYLTYIIENRDFLKSKTFRKMKLGGEQDRKSTVVKKPVTVKIEVEKIEFSKYANVLRVSGKITEGPEDIPIGNYHTLNLEENTQFSLQKNSFLKYQIEKLEEASKENHGKILICVHDRQEAYFAVLKKYGYQMIGQIKDSVANKADVKSETVEFFPHLKKALENYDKQHNFSNIVVASPGFWREYIQKLIPDNLKKKVVYATCSSVGINGINEVIKRDEVQQVLKEEKFSEEVKLVEKLLEQISKEGTAEYGLDHIKKAVVQGAVSDLLLTDNFIHKKRQDEKFLEIENLMKQVEQMKGKIHIISSEHEGGKKLDGLSGIAGLLRYKLSY